jgi:hypothetical protein
MIAKKFVLVPLFLALTISMAACGERSSEDTTQTTTRETTTADTTDDGSSGIGMTYSGKLGIDMGGGLVMPLGGTPQLGYGF